MSTRPEDKPAGQSVDTFSLVVSGTAERIVRYLKRAGSIVLVLVFAVLMLALVLAIPVGYYWQKYQASLVRFSEPAGQVMTACAAPSLWTCGKRPLARPMRSPIPHSPPQEISRIAYRVNTPAPPTRHKTFPFHPRKTHAFQETKTKRSHITQSRGS